MHRGIETIVFLWDGSGVKGLPQGLNSKVSTSNAGATGNRVQSLCRKDPLEEETVTHSSTLACEIPWTEEPGWLQPKGHKELDTTESTEHTHKSITNPMAGCHSTDSVSVMGWTWPSHKASLWDDQVTS